MSYFTPKNGESSRFPIRRKWYYSPAQALLHRLYPDLPEYSSPDIYKDIENSDWVPPVDIIESDEKFVITVELPGVEKENLSLTVHDNELWIQGERRMERDVEYYCCEGKYGTFFRKIKFLKDFDRKNIHSELKNGILSIVIPKTKENKSRSIPIK